MAMQIAKRGKELKRDLEAVLTDNNAQVAGNTSTARETGGLGAWIATNDVLRQTVQAQQVTGPMLVPMVHKPRLQKPCSRAQCKTLSQTAELHQS